MCLVVYRCVFLVLTFFVDYQFYLDRIIYSYRLHNVLFAMFTGLSLKILFYY